MTTIKELKSKIENCHNCPLRAKLSEFETPWIGVGSNQPKVMIVINGPSKEQPILITGLILEYLEKNLRLYGINKSDLYITPYVKCGRKPTKKALEACKDWVIEEMDLLNPRLVVTLVGDEEYSDFGIVTSYPTTLYDLTNRTKDDKQWTKRIFESIKQACG